MAKAKIDYIVVWDKVRTKMNVFPVLRGRGKLVPKMQGPVPLLLPTETTPDTLYQTKYQPKENMRTLPYSLLRKDDY